MREEINHEEYILNINKDLKLKIIDSNNTNDIYLINNLNHDKLVNGENGYLYPLNFENVGSLKKNIYKTKSAIYCKNHPVGYIEVSKIYEMENKSVVYISCATIKEKRKHGFMNEVILKVSDNILTDKVEVIDEVIGVIDIKNIASQNLAIKSGFIDDGLSDIEHLENGYIKYYKTKEMIKRR